jgi:hypothetical protein
MAEFRYHALREDVLDWIDALANFGKYRFVVEIPYWSPQYVEFEKLQDCPSDVLLNARAFHMWSEDYSLYPPVLEGPFVDPQSHQNWYTVSHLRGGPMLRLGVPATYMSGDEFRINSGELTYQPSYGDPTWNKLIQPTATMKSCYKQTCEVIRRMSKSHYLGVQIDPDGKHIQGARRVVIGNHAWTFALEQPTYIPGGVSWIRIP